MIMIAKGNRSKAVTDACKAHGSAPLTFIILVRIITVIAKKTLCIALDSVKIVPGNCPNIYTPVRAAVEIDPDSIFAMPGRISHYASLESGNPQARAMLELLQAQTLSGIYLSNRWRYDRVDAPLAPLPEDMRAYARRSSPHWPDRQNRE